MLKICVLQNWGLGDLVMTVPVIAELRELHPDAEIALIVRGGPQRALLEGSRLVDRILEMPKNHQRLEMIRFFVALRRHRFDLAYIATRISPTAALLLRTLSGVKMIVGDAPTQRWLFSHAGTIDPGQHRVDRMLETLGLWTGHAPGPVRIRLPVAPEAEAEAEALMSKSGITAGAFLAIHPGSSLMAAKEKRIPVATVKALIADVRRYHPETSVVLLFGPDDQDLVPDFATLKDGVISVSGVGLDVTKAILARAAGFVGSDSALGHLASAFSIPTVTLAGPTIPTETRPYGPLAAVLTRGETLQCQPCWGTPLHGNCPYDARCMTDIAPGRLYIEVRKMLDSPRQVREPTRAVIQ
jgi:ADP-heptose:LPS heptosyltransferase